MLKKEPGGFNQIKYFMDLQETKLDLALETIQAIATLGATCSITRDSIPLEELVSILDEFVERMDKLCSEQAS